MFMQQNSSSATAVRRQDFRVRWVFGNIAEALRHRIVAFWMREGAVVNPNEAWRRSWEVASVMEESATGQISGVCTVGIQLDDLGVSYGFIRLFVSPRNRLIGLNVRLMERMIEGFETMAREPGAPQRLVATLENRKIERRAAQRLMTRLGFVRVGTAANGEVIMQRALA